jgi:hypothetical protein
MATMPCGSYSNMLDLKSAWSEAVTKRIDFNRFEPSTVSAEELAKIVEAVVPTAGSVLWGGPVSEEVNPADLAELPAYRQYLEQRFGLDDSVASVALVDWSALRDTCRLLEGRSSDVRDPFVALANLAAVAGAVIFYDRVVVLDKDDMATHANGILGLDEVVRGVELAREGPGRRLKLILDDHFSWALRELDSATHYGVPWIQWLGESWQQLLPGTTFPGHTELAFDGSVGYNLSPMRESYKEVLFGVDKGSWVRSDMTDELILDNDIRALTYERFAQSLNTALCEAPGRPSIVYVGGCLRSPMLLARARWADESLKETRQPETFLQREWTKRWAVDRRDVHLPFWMTAVIASARSKEEVADRLRTLRRSTKRMRRRRGELCESLWRGEPVANRALFEALAADHDGLTADWARIAGTALNLGSALLQVAAPGPYAEIVNPAVRAAAVMGDGWLQKLALRLFRPRVYAIYRMAADAKELTDVVGTSSRLFDFERAYAEQPIDFMRRLGKISWVA